MAFVPALPSAARARPWGELLVRSNHSFLAGASGPEELVAEAARLGHAGIALSDTETVGGAVRAHVAARDAGAQAASASGRLHLAQGARVRLLIDGTDAHIELALYASDRASWGALCRLLSHRGVRGADDRSPPATDERRPVRRVHDLVELLHDHPGGRSLLGVIVPPSLPDQGFLEAAEGLAAIMGGRVRGRGHSRSHGHGHACLYPSADGGRISVAMSRVDDPEGVVAAERACVLADALGVPVVAASDVRMHHASRKPLLDTLACIAAGVPIQRAARLIAPNAERRLRPPAEIHLRYADCPEALDHAWRTIERASCFSLSELRYEYPDEVVPPELAAQGWTAMEYLKALTWRGARERYPRGVPQKVARQFEHEFSIIADLGYAPYFLTVHEIVAFARARGILCQGRGAAANSAVCFALGVTAVDPDRVDVLFERFVSRERNEPPDIDIDFEHERREEVIQHIYSKYGRDRAALVCEVISYRGRSAVRDVGKALGFAPDAVERLAKEVDRWGGGGIAARDEIVDAIVHDGAARVPPTALSGRAAERMRVAGLDPAAPLVVHYARLVDEILGFPRHRSQHVGGFVISRTPLIETVPVERAAMQDRTIIEWDKDDIEALGMLKIDVLSLGMLTAIRKTIDLVNADRMAIAAGASAARTPDAPPVRADLVHVSPPAVDPMQLSRAPASSGHADAPVPEPPAPDPLRFHAIPAEDPATYDMICKADTVGVFQIESRAQMSMLPRLRPRRFYDLVVEVAIVRPGPIQGDMVHPYLRRRSGEEAVEYPDDAIRKVLAKTLGVPLFQEQAMALAVVAAGFTPGQADELRRAIAAWKRQGNRIAQFGQALESGMLARGYSRRFATQVFEQIKGFSGYGFPESHAASFALLVYASAWLKRHHPAAFAAALLNSQPMGFYAPAQILRDARDHGVAVRAVDIHCSKWDAVLERGLDLAQDLKRDLAQVPGHLFAGAGNASDALHAGERSCRRTQQQIDASYLRLRVRHPHVRHGGMRAIECWSSSACPSAPAGRWVPIEGGDGRAVTGDRPPGFTRLHSRGRSVMAATDPGIHAPEPLYAPSREAAAACEGRDGADGSGSAGVSSHRTGAPPGSCSDFRVPSQPAIRLGLRMVRGLDVEEAHRVIDAVQRHGVFRRIADLHEASGVSTASLRRLAAAEAFASMGLDRQQATWQILALRDVERPLWSFASSEAAGAADQAEPNLPPVEELSAIASDLSATGVSLKRHPIACIRARLARARVIPCAWLRDDARTPAGRIVSVAGLVLVRQRPSTAKGIVFMTLEDETGVVNLIFRPKVYERLRGQVRHAAVVCARGKVERRDGVTHVIVMQARDCGAALGDQPEADAPAQQAAMQPAVRDFR